MISKGRHERENEITIESASENSYVRVAVEDAEAMNYPSIVLFMQIRDHVMSGWFRAAVGLDEFADFVGALRQCEKMRQGKAHFTGLSPDTLNLAIEQMDGWGHFKLRYAVGYTSHTERHQLTRTMSGGFDLDASLFERHVSLFEFLLEDAKSRTATM